MRLAAIISLAAFGLLSACATPSQRIASKLTDYGVPAREAQCMGDKLTTRLTLSQLKRLNDITRTDGDRIGRMSIPEIAGHFTRPEDAMIGAEILRAGLGCAF